MAARSSLNSTYYNAMKYKLIKLSIRQRSCLNCLGVYHMLARIYFAGLFFFYFFSMYFFLVLCHMLTIVMILFFNDSYGNFGFFW